MSGVKLDDVLARITAPWVLEALLRDFEGGRDQWASTQHGGTWGDHDGWFQVSRAGIGLSFHDEDVPLEFWKWREVRDRLRRIPADAAARLHSACAADRAHRNTFPMFGASPAAQGCGRVHGEGPQTEAQALYAAEYDAHWERVDAWYAVARPLHTAAMAARDACFAATTDAQLDLFAEAS